MHNNDREPFCSMIHATPEPSKFNYLTAPLSPVGRATFRDDNQILTGNQSSEAPLNGQWCTGSAFMQWKKTSLRSRLSCQMPGRKTLTDRLLQ